MSAIGKLLYKFYYQPKAHRAMIEKFGGEKAYQAMLAAEQQMKHYALDKLIIDSSFRPDGKYKINFLTGDRYIHQSLFCTYSFFRFLSAEEASHFSVNYYSDGTLSAETLQVLNSRFPNIKVIGIAETMDVIKTYLPESTYPWLNKKLDSQPLFKKLLYPHLNKTGSATFLDSDMLFLKRPDAFLNWLYTESEERCTAFCIPDVKRSYGYRDAEMQQVWPVPLKHNINSGMYSLYSERMDLHFIEGLMQQFETKLGPQYYMEQLLTAIILEKSDNLFSASKEDYIVLPTAEQVRNKTGVLHHYVNESKLLYFTEAWKKVLV